VKVVLTFELLQFGELGMLKVWIGFESRADPHFQTDVGSLFD